MSKSNVISNPAFQQQVGGGVGFNLITQTNSFNSIFNTKPLDEAEDHRIQKLLIDNFLPGTINEEQVEQDVTQLKQITAEIKAINRQGVVLLGERVYRAKELLKPYKDGTFTAWLESTFGTRKTGYNMLAYFELYNDLPQDDLKEKFKKIPQKAAYILASRDGDIGKKAEIIREYHEMSHAELVTLIQDKFPVSSKDKRSKKSSNDRVVAAIFDAVKKLRRRKDVLSEDNKRDIATLREMLNYLIS